MKGGEKMQNEISIDWLSFTIPLLNPDDLSLGNIERIKYELLLNSEIQPMIKNGRYSYTSAIEYSDYYTILYNDVRGRDFEKGDPSLERFLKMGIHFEFSGNGCKRLVERLKESSMDVREYLLFLSQYGVKFSRIDIAYDDFNKLLDFDVMEQKMKDGLVITKMRSSKQVEGYTKIESLGNEGKRKGVTLYFGNRGSSAFVRFYDKLAEQLDKKKPVDANIETWQRYELVLKKEKATDFVEKYKECPDLGKLYKKIMGGMIRFIDDTDINKSRCETSQFWKEFLSDEIPVVLSSKKADSDLLSVIEWFDKSVLNSLIVLLTIAEYEDIDFFELLANSKRTLNIRQQNMINEYLKMDEEYRKTVVEKLKKSLQKYR